MRADFLPESLVSSTDALCIIVVRDVSERYAFSSLLRIERYDFDVSCYKRRGCRH